MELASLAAEVGIEREHLDEALRQVLAKQGPSRLSLQLRRFSAVALRGSGVLGLTLWNYFRGAPADFLATLAALVLMGAGARLLGRRGASDPESLNGRTFDV